MTTKRPNLSSVNVLTFRSTKRARDMFIGDATKPDFGVSGDDDRCVTAVATNEGATKRFSTDL